MGIKIMVVDDDDAVRKSVAAALKIKGGYDVLEADDGLAALDLVQQQHPDLIISDVVMNNLDGFRLLETLKEYPETADIPVILMTMQALRKKEWNKGAAVEYLAKGFTISELLEKVNSILKIEQVS
jgi:CheY-like chemotaxis protein